MSKLPATTGKQLIRALGKIGFSVTQTHGSHHFLRHPDGRTATVPVHGKETSGPGLPGKILRDADLTRSDLSDLL